MAAQEKEKPAPPLVVGASVADKYRIERLLGEGGMGFVFEATHLQLGHRVALKVLNSAVMADREVVERFLREGRALARLSGEHIARVSDVGTLATSEPYMVMEFLEGRDLARELSARGPMPLHEVIEYVAQTCEALAEAHVRGIVHRDLKPANLFLTQKLDGEACIKVLDFGISKFTQEEGELDSENITVTSSLVGTPKYMSPEQIQDSRNVDSRTDIWGLGTIFYELLTQTRPFAAPSLALVCVKILHEEIPAPSSIKKELPPAVDEIIARCLKKAAGERFQNVGELVDALVTLNPNVKPSATRVMRILAAKKSVADSSGSLPGVSSSQKFIVPPPESSQPLVTPSNVRQVENAENATLTAATLVEAPSKKKNRIPLVIAAAGGAALLGGVLFFAFHSSSKAETTQPTATATASAPATTTTAAAAVTATVTATATETASAAPTATATATASTRHWRNPNHVHTTGTATAAPTGTENVLDDRR
jgi:serine/threonine-protein kinase